MSTEAGSPRRGHSPCGIVPVVRALFGEPLLRCEPFELGHLEAPPPRPQDDERPSHLHRAEVPRQQSQEPLKCDGPGREVSASPSASPPSMASECPVAHKDAPVHQSRSMRAASGSGKSQQRLYLLEREDDGRGVRRHPLEQRHPTVIPCRCPCDADRVRPRSPAGFTAVVSIVSCGHGVACGTV